MPLRSQEFTDLCSICRASAEARCTVCDTPLCTEHASRAGRRARRGQLYVCPPCRQELNRRTSYRQIFGLVYYLTFAVSAVGWVLLAAFVLDFPKTLGLFLIIPIALAVGALLASPLAHGIVGVRTRWFLRRRRPARVRDTTS